MSSKRSGQRTYVGKIRILGNIYILSDVYILNMANKRSGQHTYVYKVTNLSVICWYEYTFCSNSIQTIYIYASGTGRYATVLIFSFLSANYGKSTARLSKKCVPFSAAF